MRLCVFARGKIKLNIKNDRLERLLNAIKDENSVITEIFLDKNVVKVLVEIERIQIRDLPDRIIAATVLYIKVIVISGERKIELSSIQTIC